MQVRNLDTDWKDGVALLGLVAGLATERSRAAVNTNWTSRTWLDEHTVDMVLVNPAEARYNCEQALKMLTIELELCTNGDGDCLVRYVHCTASLLYRQFLSVSLLSHMRTIYVLYSLFSCLSATEMTDK